MALFEIFSIRGTSTGLASHVGFLCTPADAEMAIKNARDVYTPVATNRREAILGRRKRPISAASSPRKKAAL